LRHERHYTVEQANASLDDLLELLDRLRTAHARLTDEEAREALAEAASTNGGGEPGRTVSEGFLALRDGLEELQAREVVLRDLDRGLVDFPAVLDGREVYLCWEQGEDGIEYWHDLDAGHAGRQPL
jgi:hypothetical protein